MLENCLKPTLMQKETLYWSLSPAHPIESIICDRLCLFRQLENATCSIPLSRLNRKIKQPNIDSSFHVYGRLIKRFAGGLLPNQYTNIFDFPPDALYTDSAPAVGEQLPLMASSPVSRNIVGGMIKLLHCFHI